MDGTKTSKTFYLVTSKATTNPLFIIFLDDPLSVLYLICAQPGPEPSDIAIVLTRRGIPFSTRILCNSIPTAVYITTFGLGLLPPDHRPTCQIMLHTFKGEITCCAETMVELQYWRVELSDVLHMNRLGIEPTFSSLLGHLMMLFALVPALTSKIVGIGMMTWTVRTKRSYVVCTSCLLVTPSDPSLAQHTNLLLGQQQQTADVSWWPKQSIWEACGLNVGYWSTDNEIWYQKHLQKIREYDGKCCAPYHTSSDWQKALKYHRNTIKKVCDSSACAAENWLAVHT